MTDAAVFGRLLTLRNLPNLITVGRILLVPVLVVLLLYPGRIASVLAAATFFLACWSDFLDGYNAWKFQTVETLPDGNTNTVYTNFAGQVMLTVFQDAAAGLTAIETFHPDHSADDIAKYQEMARRHGLAMSGGSDYHGPGSGRIEALGQVTLPQFAFDELARRASWSPPAT